MDGTEVEIEKSKQIVERAKKVTPGGVNSPVRAFKAVGGTPRIIEKGDGAWIYDVDGNKYLDFCCSWGPLILGHRNKIVIDAISEQLSRGLTFGTSTELECELAEFITSHVDHIEKIRFVSSGTEAVMSAIRIARGFTGRELILKFEGCYHGHSDALLVKAGSGLATFSQPSSAGIPESITSKTAILPLDDDEALEKFFKEHGKELAAVIIEGIPANNGLLVQRHEYVRLMRELCEQHGVLMILDEVITGFRLGMGGAAEYYGIKPDLAAYGKIIGGGMPVGAFGGRADIMDCLAPDGIVYQAGTLSGNPIAMAAGLATLGQLADGKIFNELEEKNRRFVSLLANGLKDDVVNIAGVASLFWIVFQKDLPRAAHQIETSGISRFDSMHGQMLESGIYLPPSGYEVCFISHAHSDEMLSDAAELFIKAITTKEQAWA